MTNEFTPDVAFEKQFACIHAPNAVELSLDIIRAYLLKSPNNAVFILDHNATYNTDLLMSSVESSEYVRIEHFTPASHLDAVDVIKSLGEGCDNIECNALVIWTGLSEIHPMDLSPSVRYVSKLCDKKFSVVVPVSTKPIPRSVITHATIYTTGNTDGTTNANE